LSKSLNKSRAVARKPRKAVKISTCKASRERHTKDNSDQKRKLVYLTTAFSFNTTSPATPTNIGINVMPETTNHMGYIFAADNTCASLSILKQSCL